MQIMWSCPGAAEHQDRRAAKANRVDSSPQTVAVQGQQWRGAGSTSGTDPGQPRQLLVASIGPQRLGSRHSHCQASLQLLATAGRHPRASPARCRPAGGSVPPPGPTGTVLPPRCPPKCLAARTLASPHGFAGIPSTEAAPPRFGGGSDTSGSCRGAQSDHAAYTPDTPSRPVGGPSLSGPWPGYSFFARYRL